MGMEHERIHLETSSVLMRQLPSSMVEKPDDWIYAPLSAGKGLNYLVQKQLNENNTLKYSTNSLAFIYNSN